MPPSHQATFPPRPQKTKGRSEHLQEPNERLVWSAAQHRPSLDTPLRRYANFFLKIKDLFDTTKIVNPDVLHKMKHFFLQRQKIKHAYLLMDLLSVQFA